MWQIAEWLEKLGMSEYGRRFAENDIDAEILSELTDSDFDWLGVSIGHRRKMMRGIRELATSSVSPSPDRPTSAVTAAQAARRDTAERRQVTVMFSDLVGSTALSARMDPEICASLFGLPQSQGEASRSCRRRVGWPLARWLWKHGLQRCR